MDLINLRGNAHLLENQPSPEHEVFSMQQIVDSTGVSSGVVLLGSHGYISCTKVRFHDYPSALAGIIASGHRADAHGKTVRKQLENASRLERQNVSTSVEGAP